MWLLVSDANREGLEVFANYRRTNLPKRLFASATSGGRSGVARWSWWRSYCGMAPRWGGGRACWRLGQHCECGVFVRNFVNSFSRGDPLPRQCLAICRDWSAGLAGFGLGLGRSRWRSGRSWHDHRNPNCWFWGLGRCPMGLWRTKQLSRRCQWKVRFDGGGGRQQEIWGLSQREST